MVGFESKILTVVSRSTLDKFRGWRGMLLTVICDVHDNCMPVVNKL